MRVQIFERLKGVNMRFFRRFAVLKMMIMFSFKKLKAIKAFENQKAQVSQITLHNYTSWLAHTSDLIQMYLGESSNFQGAINNLFGLPIFQPTQHEEIIRQRLPEIERVMTNCIEFIKSHGVYKEPKPNFLASLGNELIWTIFTGSLLIAFGTGVWWVKSPLNPENYPKAEKVKEQPSIRPVINLGDSSNLNPNVPTQEKSNKNRQGN
jgi:ABC-type sugar transport system permease subunit